ncbi:MAG: class I adenylate-forming enzyme family protein, partial [Halobacteria archaeon]|nr:class I adenylate-forming enzyme family protein [Halobacteria archaeon]
MDYHKGEPIRNVAEIVEMGADTYGEKRAFEYRGDELSYQDLERRSNQVANALVEHGVEPDDRVAMYIENSLQFPETFFGIIKSGAVPVPLNHRMDMERLVYVLEDSDSKAIVGSDVFAGLVQDLHDESGTETVLLRGVENEDANIHDYDTVVEAASDDFETYQHEFDDVTLQCYTSGTTGNPKGVLTTHRNILSTVQSYSQLGGIDPEDASTLVVLPLFHMFGLSTVMLTSLYNGGEIILKTLPVAQTLLQAITEHEVTSFAAVPAIYIEMVEEYEKNPEKYDLSSIEALGSGAAPLAEDTRKKIQEVFNTPLTEGWGMTETTPAGTANSTRGVRKGAGCIGQPLPDLEIKLVDPTTRETRVPPEFLDPSAVAEPDEYGIDFDDEETVTGEMAVRGPQVFEGYHNLPDKTDEVFDDEGWFYTDDIARVDEDRFLWMVDRADDMI